MTNPDIQVILNPASGGGKTAAEMGRILTLSDDRLAEPFATRVTSGPRDATGAARAALKAGCRLVIAVGGDGTFQEVVNGFFEDGRPIRPEAELALIPAGTGNGLAQSFGLPARLEDLCAVAAGRNTRAVDVGRADFTSPDGRPESRYFVNECQTGIGGDVVRKVSSRAKLLGGRLAFGLTTVTTALSSPNRALTVSIDGATQPARRYVGIVVANGGCMAGGMRLTPGASVTDGLFDILFIHEQTVPERLRHFPKIYSGRHLESPKFSLVRGRAVTLATEPGDGAPFEADGEFWGTTPCRITVIPQAVRLRLGPSTKG